jgi:Reverse transcriptase (RNA-dependent DNA polymerase)
VRIDGAAVLLFALGMDDLLIARGDIVYLEEIKAAQSQRLEMKDLGEAQKYPGLEISRNRNDGVLTLSQAQYIRSVLSRYGMAVHTAHVHPWRLVLTCTVRVILRMICRTVWQLEA